MSESTRAHCSRLRRFYWTVRDGRTRIELWIGTSWHDELARLRTCGWRPRWLVFTEFAFLLMETVLVGPIIATIWLLWRVLEVGAALALHVVRDRP